MTIQIRPAVATDDFHAVAELYYQAWLETYADLLPASFLATLCPTTWHPERHWQHTILALDELNQPVGVVSFGASRQKKLPNQGELYSIYLLQKVQHQGLGTQLFQQASAYLTTHYPANYLWVLSDNQTAQAFYQHQGLVTSGQTRIDHTEMVNLKETQYTWPSQS